MAYTTVKLPGGQLEVKAEVEFDPELTGADHELLLSSSPTMFERNLISVITGRIKNGESRWLSTPDVLYLFFLARSHTLGAVYQAPWKCNAPVKAGKTEQACGHTNTFELNIGELDIRWSEGFTYPHRAVSVAPDPKNPTETIETEAWIRIPSCIDDLEAMEPYYELGFDRKSLTEDPAMSYKYSKERLVKSLVFADERLRDLTVDEKLEAAKAFSFSTVNALFADLRKLDTLGVDLSPRECTCAKCKVKVKVAIPFTGSFLLSDNT
jgi:hypothetical protein